jgi:hypothetical protein
MVGPQSDRVISYPILYLCQVNPNEIAIFSRADAQANPNLLAFVGGHFLTGKIVIVKAQNRRHGASIIRHHRNFIVHSDHARLHCPDCYIALLECLRYLGDWSRPARFQTEQEKGVSHEFHKRFASAFDELAEFLNGVQAEHRIVVPMGRVVPGADELHKIVLHAALPAS